MNMLLYCSNLPSSNKLAEASCFPRGIGAARCSPGGRSPHTFCTIFTVWFSGQVAHQAASLQRVSPPFCLLFLSH